MNFYYAWHLLIIIISDVARPVKLFHSPTTVRSPITECLMSDVNVGIWSLKWWSPPWKSIFVFFRESSKSYYLSHLLGRSTFSSDIAPRTSFSTFSMPLRTNSREGAAPFATRPPFLESLGAYLQLLKKHIWICNVFGQDFFLEKTCGNTLRKSFPSWCEMPVSWRETPRNWNGVGSNLLRDLV